MPAKPKSSTGPPERRLAAIMAVEIDGTGRRSREGGALSDRQIGEALRQLRSAILEASGTVFSLGSNGLTAEFGSATEALRFALRQQAEAARGAARGADPVGFRIGLHAGEILAGENYVGGVVVNIASRLRRIAPAGGIALPITLHDQLRHVVPVQAVPLGQPDLQDVAEPVVVVAISPDACLAWAGDLGPPRRPPPRYPADEPRAVLAVAPLRFSEAQQAVAAAATDDIIRGLVGVATWLAVVRTADGPASAIDLPRIRQSTGARYILHGAAEAEDGRLRLTLELNEAESSRVLWHHRFGGLQGQEAALRLGAAAGVARTVPPLLLQRESDRAALAPADDLTAHDLSLRAFATIMRPERQSFNAAADLLRQAEQRPPPHDSTRFAQVWWHLMAISQGWSADPAADARAAAAAAARTNHTDPSAMALLAFMHSVLHRNHSLASAMLDRVIEAAPFCALAGSLKALTLSWLGEAKAAIFHAEQAGAMPGLGPERAWREHVGALAYYLAGRYGEAAGWARVSAMHHPGLAANARLLAATLAVLGQLDEAHQAAQQVLAIDPDFRIGAWWERSMLAEASREIFARRLRLAGLPA